MRTPTEGDPLAHGPTPTSVGARQVTATDVAEARANLTATLLDHVGAGCYREVFGSRGWVVKVERTFRSSVATIMAVQLATAVRAIGAGREWRRGPRVPGFAIDPGSLRGRTRAFARLALVALLRACLAVAPEALWRNTRAAREARKDRGTLARSVELARRLEGSGLLIPRLQLPATRVRARWRRRFTVTTAFRRVDPVLLVHLRGLARQKRHAEINALLDRFLDYQAQLWRRGVFTLDVVPFVNYGLLDGEIVLLDEGSLTDDPLVIRGFLPVSEATLAHVEEVLRALTSQEHATRFREGLGRLFAVSSVRHHWPTSKDPRWGIGGDDGASARESSG